MKQKIKILVIIVLSFSGVIGIIGWCFESGYLPFNYPSRENFPIHGIDISHHQGDIDWDLLRQQDIQFIYMKATEGGDWVDPKFKIFWRSASERGILIGAYHFYRICKTGTEQANNFIDTVPKNVKSMPHAIDLEYIGNCKTEKSKEQIIREISDYINAIQKHYGKPPIIYTTKKFHNHFLINQLMETNIWIRNLLYNPQLPDNRKWIIWQYSNQGRIIGIQKNVDLNAFNGDEKKFTAFINGKR